MIKLVSADDGSQKLDFYSADIEQRDYSIRAPNGEDSIQVQTMYWDNKSKLLIGASINEMSGTLTWHTFCLD